MCCREYGVQWDLTGLNDILILSHVTTFFSTRSQLPMNAPDHRDEALADDRAKRERMLEELVNAETLEDVGASSAETLGLPTSRALFEETHALGEFELGGRLGSVGYGEVLRATLP